MFLKPKRDNIHIIAVLIISMQILFIGVVSYCVVMLIANPQIIGEFFGKILKGVNSIK